MLFHFTSEGTTAWRASTSYRKPHSKSRVRIWNHVQSLFNVSTVFCRIFSANLVPRETELVGKHHPLLSLPNTHLPTHFDSCHLIIERIQFILWSNCFRSPRMRSGSPGRLGSFPVGRHLLRSLWFPWSLSSTRRETAGKIRLRIKLNSAWLSSGSRLWKSVQSQENHQCFSSSLGLSTLHIVYAPLKELCDICKRNKTSDSRGSSEIIEPLPEVCVRGLGGGGRWGWGGRNLKSPFLI